MITGGAALTVGVWYQTLGAFAALVSWKFSGAPGNVFGEGMAAESYNDQFRLFLEYFDMDAALHSTAGVSYVQFKVTSQQSPDAFAREDVREILRNATKAILEHEKQSSVPVNAFIVATNIPIGQFALLQQVRETVSKAPTDPDFFASFAELDAPSGLFPEKSNDEETEDSVDSNLHDESTSVRTMRELARSITWGYATKWKFTALQCVNACLRAMAFFRFADAHPTKLNDELERWLYTWGILPSECDNFVSKILGTLLTRSVEKKSNDEFSVMQKIFSSETAVPITARSIWKAVVDDLVRRSWQGPTPFPISSKGVQSWLWDRSPYLNGLPYSFSNDIIQTQFEAGPDFETRMGPARIFVIVGPGGSGKSILLAQLVAAVASSVWDWETGDINSDPKFLGCPIVQAASPHVLAGIDASMMRWGRRREAVPQSVERIALANGINDSAPAVWLGIDGVDELSVDQLRPLANEIANYASDHPGARIVVTSRPDQFLAIRDELNANGMLREIQVDEFRGDEPIQAVRRATEYKLRMDERLGGRLEVGSREPTQELRDTTIQSSHFERSIRQPLFVGVIRRLYEEGKLDLIQSAYEGDGASLRTLTTEYVHTFCDRASHRLNTPYIRALHVFEALRKLAIDGEKPPARNAALWKMICEEILDDHVTWNALYTQCISSGLIKGLGAGAFEWTHSLVGEYLPDMKKRPDWQ
jgi:hypothetical protein